MNKRLYIFLVFFSLFLISLNRVSDLGFVRDFTRLALGPVSYGLFQVGYRASRSIHFVSSLPSLYTENQSLEEEILALKERVVDWQRLRAENDALRLQLNVEGVSDKAKVMASVSGVIQIENSIVLLVDKGQSEGVSEGGVAALNDRLVGRVGKVNSHTAEIIPIFAVKSQIPVEVVTSHGNKVNGVVRGAFNNRVILDEVTQDTPLDVGNLVVTTGEGGIYRSGLLVGEIEKVNSQNSEIFQSADLKAYWDLTTLDVLFIEK